MLVSSEKESFQGGLETAARVLSQFIGQWIPERQASNMEGPTAKCTEATSRNQKLMLGGGSQMLSTGNLRDWYEVDQQILRHLMLKAWKDS